MTKLELAMIGSARAAARVRHIKQTACGTAAVGHIPFPGHRTMATVMAQQAAARRREREVAGHRNAMKYGFDPASLKASGR